MATGLAAIGKAAPTASLGIVIVQVVAVPARNRTPKKAFSDSFVCGMIRSPIQKERKGREGKGREGTDAAPSALPESRFSSSKIPHRHRTVKAKSRINTDFILFPGARHSTPARPVTPPMRLAPDRYASRHNPRHACHRTSAKITGTEQSERINPDIIIGDCVTSSACLYELAAIAF